jgi:hypothetical protein
MVNTFIPYSNFKRIASILDYKRLGKQRVEAKQILNILLKLTKKKGFTKHPIVHMWRNHTDALKYYYNCMVQEWIQRGYKNNMKLFKLPKHIEIPWFVKCKSINLSHQASLLRKYPAYYKKIFVPPPPKLYMIYKYIWLHNLPPKKIEELKNNCNTIVNIREFAEPV